MYEELQRRSYEALTQSGWVNPTELQQAFQFALNSRADLLDVLVHYQRISADQSQTIRQLLAQQSNSRRQTESRSSGNLTDSLSRKSKSPVQPGMQVGHYKIEERLGEGGQGAVFLTKNTNDSQRYVLKVLFGEDEEDIRRFMKEIQALTGLDHPNIISVFECGEIDGALWYSMPHIAATALSERISASNAESLSLDEIVAVHADIADALQYCHQRNVIHRDIKPSNILVKDGSKQGLLIDFGLATRNRDSAQPTGMTVGLALSQTQDLVGTPAFMSPEQVDPSGKFGQPTGKTDVWGIGASLFYCLAGRHVFESQNPIALIQQIVTDRTPSVSSFNAQVPKWLVQVISQCLQKSQENRLTIQDLNYCLSRRRALPNRSVRAITAIVLLSMTAISVALLLPRMLTGEISQLSFNSQTVSGDEPVYFSQSKVHLSGKATKSTGAVTVLGQSIPVVDHEFSGDIDVSSLAPNTPLIVHYDYSQRSINIQSEKTSPKAIIPKNIDKANLFTNAGKDWAVIEFQVEDQLPGMITWCSLASTESVTESSSYAPGKTVSIKLKLRSSRPSEKFRISLTDVAGNESKFTVRVVRTELQYHYALEVLSSINRWNRLRNTIKQRLIKAVSEKLADRFEYVNIKSYRGHKSQRPVQIARFKHKKLKLIFHLIPGGEYIMGGRPSSRLIEQLDNISLSYLKESESREIPAHKVKLTPFLLAQTETSFRQWRMHMKLTRKRKLDLPVTGIQYSHVLKFLEKLGDGGRLPSETEWEWACRANTSTLYYWGNSFDNNHVVAKPKFEKAVPVNYQLKKKRWNSFGLVDMIGNSWEWCADIFAENYETTPRDNSPHKVKKGYVTKFPRRGGCVASARAFLRSRSRGRTVLNSDEKYSCFRLAYSLPGL